MNGSSSGANGLGIMTEETRPAQPLQTEIETAQAALKNVLLQLGLLSRFQRDVRTLGVEDYASKPPSSLTNALTQAVKAYNDACDSMQVQIMRAKAVLLYKPEANEETPMTSIEENHGASTEPTAQTDEPMLQEDPKQSSFEQDHPDKQTSAQEAARATSASLLNNDEMADLFGPGTVKTDTSTSTPANGGSVQAQQMQPESSQTQSGDGQAAPAPTVFDLSTVPHDTVSHHTSNAPAGITSENGQNLDQASSMFDFGNSSAADSAISNIAPTNFDFSHMTSDDFNSLLASLGASAGGDEQQDSGNNLLQGLNLDADLSTFLNTDINLNPSQ